MSALAHGAISVGTLSNGHVVSSIVVDRKTKDEASADADKACQSSMAVIQARDSSLQSHSDCSLKAFFTNACAAVVLYDPFQWYIETGVSEEDALGNANVVGARNEANRRGRILHACDTRYAGVLYRLAEATEPVQSWLSQQLTTFTVLALGVFALLAAGLAYALLTIRRLQRVIVANTAPGPHIAQRTAESAESPTPQTIIPSGDMPIGDTANVPKAPAASDATATNPELDKGAIKEAFKRRREEYEL